MVENIVNLLDGATAKILLVVFVGFALYVLLEFRGHIKETFKKHETSIQSKTDSFKKDLEKVQYSLALHSEDMSRNQKEIEGQSLRLREDLLEAKVGVNDEINKTKIGIVTLNKTLENLADKVARYRESLESTHGKILRMEKHLNKNENEIGKVINTLEIVKEDYGKVKLIAEKGKAIAEKTEQIAERQRPTIKKVEAIFARNQKKKGKNGV